MQYKLVNTNKDMEDIRIRKEFCLLSGDMNKHVGTGNLGMPGNHPGVSLGGRLLREPGTGS